LIGINTCKYGIEYAKQKTTSSTAAKSRIFCHKKKSLQFVPHASVYPKKKSPDLWREKLLLKKKIGNLIDSMFCDDSYTPAMDNTEKQTEAFDIDEFV